MILDGYISLIGILADSLRVGLFECEAVFLEGFFEGFIL